MCEDPIRRAAMVVANLDTRAADELLDRMPEEQATAIRSEILAMSETDYSRQENVLRDFLHPPASADTTLAEKGYCRPPASTSTSNAASPALDGLSPSVQDLMRLDNEEIVMSIAHERAPLIASLLAGIPGPRAASMLRLLPESLQSRVLLLLSRGIAVQDDVIDEVAEFICDCSAASARHPTPGMRHQDALQAILDAMGPQERLEMLRSLEAENPLLARRLAETGGSIADCYC